MSESACTMCGKKFLPGTKKCSEAHLQPPLPKKSFPTRAKGHSKNPKPSFPTTSTPKPPPMLGKNSLKPKENSSRNNSLKLAQVSQENPNKGQTEKEIQLSLDPEQIICPGFYIGEYCIQEKIGQGGMGDVWRAEHSTTKIQVAIKVLSQDLLINRKAMARFLQEARAVNKLQHENLVDIFSFGEMKDGRPYLIMEYLSGKSLRQYLEQQGPLPFSEILWIFQQTCTVLQVIHDRGIIHRDLKPDNIFLQNLSTQKLPRIKLLDFGIAKLNEVKDTPKLTRTGAIFGTPGYMAPEQYQGGTTGVQGDLYSLGVVLFESICGRSPFGEPWEPLYTVIAKQISEKPPKASDMVVGRQIPDKIDAFLCRVLDKHPETRPDTCTGFFDELSNVLKLFRGETKTAIKNAKPVFLEKPEEENKPLEASEKVVKHQKKVSRTGDYYVASPDEGAIIVAPKVDLSHEKRRAWPWFFGSLIFGMLVSGYFLFFLQKPPVESKANSLSSEADKKRTTSVFTAFSQNQQSISASLPVKLIPPPLPEEVSLQIETVPKNANIFREDGSWIGHSPKTLVLPYGESLKLRVEKRGYQSVLSEVDAKKDEKILLKLQSLPKKTSTSIHKVFPKKPTTPQTPPKRNEIQQIHLNSEIYVSN